MKEIIEMVSNFETAHWVGTGVVGLILLTALPFVIWRMIIGIPKLIWASSRACTFLIVGGIALYGGLSVSKWAHSVQPRLKELKGKHGDKEGLRRFYEETLPSLPEDKKIKL